MYDTISQGYESHTENTVCGCHQSDCLTCSHTYTRAHYINPCTHMHATTVWTHIIKITAPEHLLHISPMGEGVAVLGEELDCLRVQAEVLGSPRKLLK